MTIASSVLQRSHSCPDFSALRANSRPATALGQDLLRAQARPATLQRSHPLDPNQFATLFKQQSRDALFAAAASPEKQQQLRNMFDASRNTYAQHEIDAFAKLYSQLIAKPDLSEAAKQQLQALAQQYTDRILKDGLNDPSAFGAWEPKVSKHYEQRSKLEHQLAEFAKQHTEGDFLQLGNQFKDSVVMPFIQDYVQAQLGGRQLDDETLKNLPGLVDQAAKQAFDALREARAAMSDLHGFGVGKLARDLDTVAVLPLLLRNILAGLPKDTVSPSATPPAAEAAGPGGPTPAGPQQPAPGLGGITINMGGIHIDNRQHTDNSRHIDNSRRSTWQGGRVPRTSLAPQVKQCVNVNQRQGDSHGTQAGTGMAGLATERTELHMRGPRDERHTLQPKSQQGRPAAQQTDSQGMSATHAMRSDASSAQTSTQDERVLTTDSNSLRQTNAPGDTSLSQDAFAEQFKNLKFRDGPLRNPQHPDYLRSARFQSQDDRLPAERLLVSLLRDALEPHPAQPLETRLAFDRVRNQVLPNDPSGTGGKQDEVLRAFAQGDASKTHIHYAMQLSKLLVKHPLHDQLRSEAQLLARSTNLLNGGGNPLLIPFLSALGVGHASATTTSSSASSLRQMVRGVGTGPIARADAAIMTDGVENAVTMARQQATDEPAQPFRSVASLDLRLAGGAKLVKAAGVSPGTSLSPGAVMPNDAAKTGFRAQDNAEQTTAVDTAVETMMKTGAALSPVQERREGTTEHSAADRDTLSQSQGAGETSSPRSEAGSIRFQKPAVSATVTADASKDADSFAGLNLQTPRALYTLSTAASRQRQQQAGLFNAEKELLRACMDGLELQPNQPQAARAAFAELRFKMVNGQHGTVSQDDAQKLRRLLDSNVKQLAERKQALSKLVGDMVRQNGMFPSRAKTESAPPVVATVMEWLQGGQWQDWVDQQRPAKRSEPLALNPSTLSTDGLHFDVRNLRRESKH
ncbi:hypothetical protein [Chromobacterium amazonense]|uniref:Salmonella invasion protein A N-terminal domain-containing protein n=1 Tax=Chromobacterium amazonense TaxID=1382803 RepID=A0ABU8V2K1_9NEIS|nr:hypothetical protein [Chromobacterium amazonense]MDQ4541464.1 hypothetical protein [Chromobacterium amazonense]